MNMLCSIARASATSALVAMVLAVGLVMPTQASAPVSPGGTSAAPGHPPKPEGLSWSGVADQGGTRSGAQGRITVSTDGEQEPASSPETARYDRDDEESREIDGLPRLEIRLQQARFDPLVDGVTVLPALAQPSRGGDGTTYRIVQFKGPLRAAWRDALVRQGATILEYVPDFALLVRVDATRSAQLDDVEGVRWTGPFVPAFRLASELVNDALAPRSGHRIDLVVRGFAGEDDASLRVALRAAGAEVGDHALDGGGGAIVRATALASSLIELASLHAVAWIEPVQVFTYSNAVARSNQLTAKEHVEQSYGLFGAGQAVAVVDSGLSSGNPATVHADFSGRVLGGTSGPGSCGHWADTNGHGTHVAGSVLGSGARSGSNPAANQYAGSQAGIAPKAGLLVWATCDDFSGLPVNPYEALWSPIYAFNTAVRTSNNSWGTANSAGAYTTFTRETDRFVSDYFDMAIVFAAGNDGNDQDVDGVSDMGTVMAPSTAKNVITVGASENLRASGGYNPGGPCASYGECWPNKFMLPPLAGDRLSNHPDGMVAFSGRGPTRSGRLKPDIVAPGTNIVSAQSEMTANTGWGVFNPYYQFQGGTSMASPLVAGGVAVVREFFQVGYNHSATAALVKATLLNGAWDMSPGQYGAGAQQDVWRRPDIHQGWGTMDLSRTLVGSPTRAHTFWEVYPGLQTGQQWQSEVFVAAAGSELRVQLVWIDKPGMEATHGALVNDLDLEVVAPDGSLHYGFAGLVGQQRDRYNNAEGVRLAAAAAGRHVVRVRGFNVPMGPQPFSMAVNGHLANDVIFRNGFDPG